MQYIGKWNLRSRNDGGGKICTLTQLWLKYPYKVNSILSPNWGIFLPFQFSVIFTPLSLFLKSGICLESFLKECRKHSSLLASRAWRFDRIRIWKTFWFLFVNKTFLNYFNALTLEVESNQIEWISNWFLSNFSNYFSPSNQSNRKFSNQIEYNEFQTNSNLTPPLMSDKKSLCT